MIIDETRILLAVDPGESPGLCVVARGEVHFAGQDPDAARAVIVALPGAARVITLIEKPVIRPGGKSRPNDQITLALAGGCLALRACPWAERVEGVEPVRWKGSLKKEVHHAQIRKVLARGVGSPLGLSWLRAWDLAPVHDVRDAIALAHWRLSPAYSPVATSPAETWREISAATWIR